MIGVSKKLQKMGCNVVALHKTPIEELRVNDVNTIWGISIKQWMGILEAADYVISVDTAAFHFAGGIKKPLVGIFTFMDGKTYGKYYDFVLVQKHRDNGDWDCGPCFDWPQCPKCPKNNPLKPCLTEISVDMIMEGIEKMFELWPHQTPLKQAP